LENVFISKLILNGMKIMGIKNEYNPSNEIEKSFLFDVFYSVVVVLNAVVFVLLISV
jgi:hypothetical protein